MLVLIYSSTAPSVVPLESVMVLNSPKPTTIVVNRPPVAVIDGPDAITVKAGQRLQLSGKVSDADGPEQPLAAWDSGDDTEIVYGTSVAPTFARPGKYVVKLRATDSRRERVASVAATITDE
jgi:hypothetical protein